MKRTIVFLGIAGLALAGCQPVDPKIVCLRYDADITRVRERNGTAPIGLNLSEEVNWYRARTTQDQWDEYDEIGREYSKKLNTRDPSDFCGKQLKK